LKPEVLLSARVIPGEAQR